MRQYAPIWLTLIFIVAAAGSAAAQSDSPEGGRDRVNPFPEDREQIYPAEEEDGGYWTEEGWYFEPWRLTAPGGIRRNGVLYALMELPAMEAAGVVDPGHAWVSVQGHASAFDHEEGNPSDRDYLRVDGWLMESVTEIRFGIGGRFEGFVRGIAGNLQESGDDTSLLRLGGRTVTPTGDRSGSLSDLVIGGKYMFREFAPANRPSVNMPVDLGASVYGHVKVPLADEENFLTTGAREAAAMLAITDQWGPFIVHFNGGGNWSEEIEDFFVDDVDPDLVAFAGISAVYPYGEFGALYAQLQGNSEGFSELEFVDEELRPVGTFGVGGRYFTDGLYLEGGTGVALTDSAPRFSLTLSVGFEY